MLHAGMMLGDLLRFRRLFRGALPEVLLRISSPAETQQLLRERRRARWL